MSDEFPILASSRRAAKLLDLSESEFLRLVDDGHLPAPIDLAGHKRWDANSLRRIATGAAADGMEGVQWRVA